MKMKEMDNFTISQSQIESGHWYQPYIHSVPYTFNRAQEAYYNGFSLDTAKNNLKKIAQKIFATLKTYYGSREKAFAKHLYGTEDLTRLAADIKDFITNFQAQYTSNRTNKYPLMDSLSTALDGLSSMKPSEADLMKAGKAKVIEALKKASVNPSKLGVNYVNQVTVVKSVIIDYLTIILKNIPNVQHPDQLAGDTFIALITGKPLSGLTKELKNTTKVLQQEVKYLKDFLEALRRGITPKLKDGKLRQGSIASSLSNNIGIFAESMVEEVIDDLIASGTTKIFQNVKVRVEQVGKKDVLKDITDTKIIFNNGIEDFEIGLDIKYNWRSDTSRQYKRGRNVKRVKDVFDTFPDQRDVNRFIYLIVNSYYFKSSPTLSKDWYSEFIAKGGRKFYGLLNTVVALYGLLPTSIKVNDSIDNVAVKIKRDKRFFIVVDGNVLLMTKFLEKIESAINTSSIQDKPLRGFEQNLKETLNTWNAGQDIVFPGSLYNKKIALIEEQLGVKQKGQTIAAFKRVSFYDNIKTQLIDVFTGTDLNNWKYVIDKNIFEF